MEKLSYELLDILENEAKEVFQEKEFQNTYENREVIGPNIMQNPGEGYINRFTSPQPF